MLAIKNIFKSSFAQSLGRKNLPMATLNPMRMNGVRMFATKVGDFTNDANELNDRSVNDGISYERGTPEDMESPFTDDKWMAD
jgi:hypothetical protein